MPLTTSGRLVKPGGTEYPSLIDIAVSLSRQPRFAGHCRRWWSVLDHTLFCDELVKAESGQRMFRLGVLLHDAHEAITADVPTDYKVDGLKRSQQELDVLIFDAYYPAGYREGWKSRGFDYATRRIDRRALCAEARVVGPPATPERTLELFGVCEETVEDVKLLESLMWRRNPVGRYDDWTGLLGMVPSRDYQEGHPAVREYLNRMVELL
jgi:5'-deoxynucleotidase YfbR-like HD superfamily hydrolase